MRKATVSVVMVAGASLFACSSGSSSAPATSAGALAWSCDNVAVPGGETLECATYDTAEDPAADTDSNTTGSGSSSGGTEGSAGSEGSGGSAGSAGSGDTATGSSGQPSASVDSAEDYATETICVAGEPGCPPADATTGPCTGPKDGASSGTNGGSGGGSSGSTDSSSGSAGSGSSGSGSSSGGGKGGKGGNGGNGGSGSTPDAGVGGSAGGSAGGSSGDDTYVCVDSRKQRRCTRERPACRDGYRRDGRKCVPVSGGADAGSGNDGNPSSGDTTQTSNCLEVGYAGKKVNSDGSVSYSYDVRELACAQDLSNWVLGLPGCRIVGGSPRYELVNPDPNAHLEGIKWETGDGFSQGRFTVTVANATGEGRVTFATKAPKVAYGQTTGPVCVTARTTPR